MPFQFSEKIIWTEPLRGPIPLTEREEADAIGIGGLRIALDRIGRLQMVAAFGKRVGTGLRRLLSTNMPWVNLTCDAIG